MVGHRRERVRRTSCGRSTHVSGGPTPFPRRAVDGGDLANVNLADGLVVDGYQFLIRHLSIEPLADESVPTGPVVGPPRGAAIDDGEDVDSLDLGRTASSYHLDVRLGAAVRDGRLA